jgi:hypothetical protein
MQEAISKHNSGSFKLVLLRFVIAFLAAATYNSSLKGKFKFTHRATDWVLGKTAALSETLRSVCVCSVYCHSVTVISVTLKGWGRGMGLRHLMKTDGHCCVNKPEYFIFSCLDGRPSTECGLGGQGERTEGRKCGGGGGKIYMTDAWSEKVWWVNP